MTHPLSQAEAQTAMTNAERLAAYDRLMRCWIPNWQDEYRRSTAQMWKAYSAAANPKGSLRDLATFILAANASHNAQCSLLGSEKQARDTHPASRMEFGT